MEGKKTFRVILSVQLSGENDAVGRTTVVANSLRITRVADADFVSSTGQTRSLVELARCITNNSGIERWTALYVYVFVYIRTYIFASQSEFSNSTYVYMYIDVGTYSWQDTFSRRKKLDYFRWILCSFKESTIEGCNSTVSFSHIRVCIHLYVYT